MIFVFIVKKYISLACFGQFNFTLIYLSFQTLLLFGKKYNIIKYTYILIIVNCFFFHLDRYLIMIIFETQVLYQLY